MSKKKSKKKILENPRIIQAKHKRDYLTRIKMVCDVLGGSGWFEVIPDIDLDILYEKRYPPLTVKIATGNNINPNWWRRYSDAMREMLNLPFLVNENTGQLPLKLMLSEGLSLLHYIAMMEVDRFPRSEELRFVFGAYSLGTGPYYQYIGDDLTQRLFMMDVRSGNYRDGFLQANATETNYKVVKATANTIFVELHKPILDSVKIDGKKREIVALARPVPRGKTIHVHFKPSAIGLKSDTDEPLPVYLQHHAIDRLDERLGLRAEIVHPHLFFSLFNQSANYVAKDDHTLIEFNMYEYKVGYLLTTLHEDKLIIRSFLFLTNDGTPEGKKLLQLTGLEKYDKKYLGIDKLSTFTSYHIHEDENLSAIFEQAGCGSLLDARMLDHLSTAFTPERNKNILHKFLQTE